MTVEKDRILEWKRQQRFHNKEYERHKLTIKGESILPGSPEGDARLNAELEMKAAEHKAEYDRLEILIQGALAEAKAE